MRKQQMGFTLVEIAIVLVIIGLLLGGVLKGQELVNSAKVKNLANDFRSIPTFVYAYQDKFRALPGDDRAAEGHLGGPLVTGTNGNGNARIEGAWNNGANGAGCGAAPGSESCNFWLHVRLANLATGTTDVNSPDYFPRNAEGGPIGITGTAPVAGWAGNYFVCSANIQGRFVRQLDTTIDDGNTSTGTLRVIGQGEVANGAFVAVTPADDATLYTVCTSN